MTSPLLLDGLLLLVILLFVPIGLWRGGMREAVVAAGVVLGGALAGAWARPWGDDLAGQLDLRPQTARFLVALAALLGATLCVGYAGGAVLRPDPPGLLGRVAGGLLAGLNGLLLLGYGLGFLDQYVLERRSVPVLSDGLVVRFLMNQFGWLLLVLVALILPLILAAAVSPSARRNNVNEPGDGIVDDGATVGGPVARPRPVRVPALADAGKFEPLQHAGMPSNAGQSVGTRWSEAATTTLRAGDLSITDRPPPSLSPMERKPDRSKVSRNPESEEAGEPARTGTAIVDEWLRRAARPSAVLANEREQRDLAHTESAWEQGTRRDTETGEQPTPEAWPQRSGGPSTGRRSRDGVDSFTPDGLKEIETEGARQESTGPDRDPARIREARHCRSCNGRLNAADAYCPTCGSSAS